MKHYELIFILPGTLTDEEVKPLVERVKTIINEAGATELQVEVLGKNRLAYPMKHIRYGYFQLCRFQAEPTNVLDIEKKINLMPEVLRAMIKKYNPKVKTEAKIAYVDMDSKPVWEDRTKEKTEVKREAKRIDDIEIKRDIAPPEDVPVVKKPKEKKEVKKKMSLEDIDKQLDEILDSGIPGV